MTKMKLKILFSPPDMSEEEAKEVKEAILSGWITTGPRTKKLEAQISEYVGTVKTVCLSSATAALEMVLHLLDLQPEDEVIVPAYTYTATASGTAATLTWTAASNTTVVGALNTEITITSGTEFELAEGANTITLTVSREGYQDRVYTITIPVEESESNESNP